MKTKNRIITLMMLTAGTAAATAAINKYIKISATSKKLMDEPEAHCYKWRLGTIHYTKTGNGKPLLLIHNLDAASSGFEWSQLINRLKDSYTVYNIDLLGCGRSEKPNMVYTNYLYVQLISDFIKSEIGHRTNVIAAGESAAFTIMSCSNNPELFDQVMLINPLSLITFSQIPGKMAKIYKLMLETPILGTLLYHIGCSKQAISEMFTSHYFYNPYSVKGSFLDTYYESAHLGAYPKALYASVKCSYTKCNIVNALKKINNSIYIIGGGAIDDIHEILEEYEIYNPAIETAVISKTKFLPQMEAPAEMYQTIKTYLG